MNKKTFFYIILFISLLIILFTITNILNDVKYPKGFGTFTYQENLNVSEDLQKIIYYGTLAANSHNSQMWKVNVTEDNPQSKKIVISQDKSRLLSISDPTNKETMICTGTFIGNIERAAQAIGYEFDTKVIATDYFSEEIATITFTKNNATINTSLLNTMELTDTIRSNFETKDLLSNDLNDILNVDSQNIFFYNVNSDGANYIKKSIIDVTEKDAEDKAKEEEKSNWIRLSNKDIIKTRDGISPEMLRQPFYITWFLHTFPVKSIMGSNLFKSMSIKETKKQVENCAGYIVITSSSNSVSDLINVGRNMQNLWFVATEKNIAINPMTAMLLSSPWKDEISNAIGMDNKNVNVILRVGYLKKLPKPNSMRRNIADITTTSL